MMTADLSTSENWINLHLWIRFNVIMDTYIQTHLRKPIACVHISDMAKVKGKKSTYLILAHNCNTRFANFYVYLQRKLMASKPFHFLRFLASHSLAFDSLPNKRWLKYSGFYKKPFHSPWYLSITLSEQAYR